MQCEERSESSTRTGNTEVEMKLDVLEFPTVATSIFKHLPARDLSSCAKVCRSWNLVANGIKENRRCIYIITKVFVYEQFESILLDPLVELCSEPNLALFIGFTEVQRDMENCFYTIQNIAQKAGEDWEYLAECKLNYAGLMRTAIKEFEHLRNFLPTNCTMLQLAMHLWSYSDDGHFLRCGMILIPRIPGVEIRPFKVPVQDYDLPALNAQMECLFPSERRIKEGVKCILMFADQEDISKMLHTGTNDNLAVGNFTISQDTIVVGGEDYFSPLSTGIAFTGQNVRVLAAVFETRDCCIRQGYLNLKSSCSEDEGGIAFVLSICSRFEERDMSLLSEYFPKIPAVVIVVTSVKIFTPVLVKSVQMCDECSVQLATSDYNAIDYMVILMLFKGSTYKSIHLN